MSELECKLITLLEMVNGWLKFAEAKNAGLIALSGAGIAAILNLLSSSSNVSVAWMIGLFAGVALLCVGCLISLISFLPKTNVTGVLAPDKGEPTDTDNLYFFGHLCKYTPEQMIESITRLYFPNSNQVTFLNKNHHDIAAQVIVNSRITSYKLRLFSIATFFVFAGVLAIIIIPTLVKVILLTKDFFR